MRCQAKNKTGKRCGAPAVHGAKICVMHSGRAAELGSRGGRRRAVYSPDHLKVFSPPTTPAELRELLAQTIVDIRAGRMDPKLANSISYLSTSFLRAVEEIVAVATDTFLPWYVIRSNGMPRPSSRTRTTPARSTSTQICCP